MENRPFDHFYGFAPAGHLTPEKIDGLVGCCPWRAFGGTSPRVCKALREYLAKAPRPAGDDDDADDDEADDDAHDDDGDDDSSGEDDDDEPDETSTVGFRAADHPLDQQTKVLYNDYASEDKFVSFAYTDAPPGEAAGGHWLRATYTAVADAMPIRFDKVNGHPDTYTLYNSWAAATRVASGPSRPDATSYTFLKGSCAAADALPLIVTNTTAGEYTMRSLGGDYVSYCDGGCAGGRWLAARAAQSRRATR